MNNTIQLYMDEKQEIKGYPITSPDRVIDENGVNIKEQLDNIKSHINKRIFKPELWQMLYVRNNTVGNFTVSRDRKLIDTDLEIYKDVGIEGIQIPIHLGFNGTTIYSQVNDDTLDYVFSRCKELKLKVKIIKFHQEYSLADIFTMGEENFKNRIKFIFDDICKRYHKDIEYVGLFNEWQHFYSDLGFGYNGTQYYYVPFVLECMDIPKVYGLKCSCSCAGNMQNGWSSWQSLNEDIREKSDIFLINGYPVIGNKKEKTTYEDCLLGMDNYNLHETIKEIRDKYAKKIIWTETGTTDYWNTFFAPGNSKMQTGGNSNGKTHELYLSALMESYKDYDDLIAVTWWYTSAFRNFSDNLKPIVNKYLGRDI